MQVLIWNFEILSCYIFINVNGKKCNQNPKYNLQ
jgi:hypothetical protein